MGQSAVKVRLSRVKSSNRTAQSVSCGCERSGLGVGGGCAYQRAAHERGGSGGKQKHFEARE